MKDNDLLNSFENKYRFLYDIMVNGIPIYTCMRDDVLFRLQGGQNTDHESGPKGRIYPRRIIDSIIKMRRLKNARTLIFTSAVYRRDRGRNLAAEYLMERYPDAVVFEWPARNNTFDSAYFNDPNRERYCPLDWYIVKYKIGKLLHRKTLIDRDEQIRIELRNQLTSDCIQNTYEMNAINYIVERLPSIYADTEFSQSIFQMIFIKYKNVEYAIDFWGSGRENIFPVLQGSSEKVELQHGLISRYHPGYIYPSFVRDVKTDFFDRTLLVYRQATKELLTTCSIFRDEQIEVIGNPRIDMYRKVFGNAYTEKKYILFTSQAYEQDGNGANYYDTVIPVLKQIASIINNDQSWCGYKLAVKLHPRENEGIVKRYKSELKDAALFGGSSELYDLLQMSYLHITASSTVLYEAAEFDVPTILIKYSDYTDVNVYGFKLLTIDKEADSVLSCVKASYNDYLNYIQNNIDYQRNLEMINVGR